MRLLPCSGSPNFLLFLGAFFLGTSGVLSSGSALAQYAVDSWTAPAMAMGGATRALADDGSATELNPAALAFMRRYAVQTDYRLYTPHAAHQFSLYVIDNMTSSVGASVLTRYGWASELPGQRRSGWVVVGEDSNTVQRYFTQDYKVGLGVPLAPFLSLGAAAGVRRFRLAEASAFNESPANARILVDAAVHGRPSAYFNVALVGNNLVPTGLLSLPTSTTLAGSAQLADLLKGELDLTVDFTSKKDLLEHDALEDGDITLNVQVGGAAVIRRYFPVRFGYYTESVHGARYATAGMGLQAPAFTLFYSVRYTLTSDDDIGLGSERLYHGISLSAAMGSKK